MGVYYYLVNDTKREYCHYDSFVKGHNVRFNNKVHLSFVNYMMDNKNCNLRVISDSGIEYDKVCEWKEIDLKDYNHVGYYKEQIDKILLEDYEQISKQRVKDAIELRYKQDGNALTRDFFIKELELEE